MEGNDQVDLIKEVGVELGLEEQERWYVEELSGRYKGSEHWDLSLALAFISRHIISCTLLTKLCSLNHIHVSGIQQASLQGLASTSSIEVSPKWNVSCSPPY